MLPVREEEVEDRQYHENLAIVRRRILGFVVRKLVPHRADYAQAEDIAQSCVIALWEQYPGKRDLAEMVRIAVGAARHKISQFHRDREKAVEAALPAGEPYDAQLFERVAAREDTDRLLLAMLQLAPRCRELLRLKLIEQASYAEIRGITGISGNIYEMVRRCFRGLLRHIGGLQS